MKATWTCRWGVMVGLSLAGCSSTDGDAGVGAGDIVESIDSQGDAGDTQGDVGSGDVADDSVETPGDTIEAPGDAPPPDDVPSVEPCADGGGCHEHATCSPKGDQAQCECNKGWVGTGITCSYEGVIVSRIDTFEVGGFTTALPGDPSDLSLVRIITEVDGVRTIIDADPPVDGLYYFPGVPVGTYTLELWSKPNASLVGAGSTVFIHESSERVLAIGTDFSYRAGTTLLTQPTTLEVSGALTTPWESEAELDDGSYSELEDRLVVYSRGAFLLSMASTMSVEAGGAEGPVRGDTALDGWAIDIRGGSLVDDGRELDGGLGDDLIVAHMRHAVASADITPSLGLTNWYTLISWFGVADVTLNDGGTLPISGTFQTKPPTSVTFAYDGDSFNTHFQPFESAITRGLLTATILAESATPTPKVGPFLPLMDGEDRIEPQWADPYCNLDTDPCDAVACPNGCSKERTLVLPGERTLGFDVVNPLDYGQLLADIGIAFTVDVSAQVPVGQAPERAQGGFVVSDSVAALTSGPVKPVIGLPRDIQVSGKSSSWSEAIRGVGTTPRIAWNAPTTGTPSRYRVQVWDLTNLETIDGVFVFRRVVVNALVGSTSLDIPDGVLEYGHHYIVDVVAELRDGYDPAMPYRSSVAEVRARMPSGVFAPSLCHKDAIIELAEGGIEVCKCKEGWVGDGLQCTPLPCAINNGGCADDATCTNGESAICTCPDGKVHVPEGLCVFPGDLCSAALPLVTSVTGTTDGYDFELSLEYENKCLGHVAGEDSPDRVYTFTAPSSGSFTFTLEATYSAVLYLRSTCYEGCLGAAEKQDGSNLVTVTVSLDEGQEVFVIVDGNPNGATPNAGPFTLSVAAVPPT